MPRHTGRYSAVQADPKGDKDVGIDGGDVDGDHPDLDGRCVDRHLRGHRGRTECRVERPETACGPYLAAKAEASRGSTGSGSAAQAAADRLPAGRLHDPRKGLTGVSDEEIPNGQEPVPDDGKQHALVHEGGGSPEANDTNERGDDKVEILQPSGEPAPHSEEPSG